MKNNVQNILRGDITGRKYQLKMVGFLDNENVYYGVHEVLDGNGMMTSAVIYEQRLVDGKVHHLYTRWASALNARYALNKIEKGESHASVALGTEVHNCGETLPWFMEEEAPKPKPRTVSCGLLEMYEISESPC